MAGAGAVNIETNPLVQKLQRQLRSFLSASRYQHVQACAQLAATLASCQGVSPERAYLAGLLHDCARDLPQAKLKKIVNQYRGRHCPAATRKNPRLWHNPAGVYLAQNTFGIQDPLILRAIALHSTGAPRMGILDKIIYVVDYCEPHRRHATAAAIRKIADKDLQAALRRVTQEKTAYLKNKHQHLHPYTLELMRELGLNPQ